MKRLRTAVYSTVFPGVEPFLKDWYSSLNLQDDKDFDLWLGVDGLSIEALEAAAGQQVRGHFVLATPGESPASLRGRVFERISSQYDAIIFADADDIHCTSRVSQGKAGLQSHDLFGCSIDLVDRKGKSLGYTLSAGGDDWSETLATRNIFGLTNSSIRAEVLKSILPIPVECRLVDWYLAASCLLDGRRLGFAASVGTKYRVYESSATRVLPPVALPDLVEGTQFVLEHFRLLSLRRSLREQEREWIDLQSSVVERFEQFLRRSPVGVETYLSALNRRQEAFWWWNVIAKRELRWLWDSSRVREWDRDGIGGNDGCG